MAVTTKKIIDILNTIAPFGMAESWDNSGLQVGSLSWPVKKIMIALDVTIPLMEAAKKLNCDLVLTHHPLLMSPEKSINFDYMPGNVIKLAASEKISIVSAHTNLDKAQDGLNDYFASQIGLDETTIFVPDTSLGQADEDLSGIGRVATLKQQINLKQLVFDIKNRLGLEQLRVSGNLNLSVSKVAICTGSGGSHLHEFLDSDAQVYITGDTKYHDARAIEENKKGLIDVGHFASEHMAIDLLHSKLSHAFKTEGLNIKLEKFLKEKDPYTIV